MTTTRSNNKGRRPLAMVLALVLLPMSLTACAKADVTLHEPGVYKGGDDPLLAKQQDPQQVEALQERFGMGQSDR